MAARLDIVSLPIAIAAITARARYRLLRGLLAAGMFALLSGSGVYGEPATPTAVATAVPIDNSSPERISREYLIKAAILYNLAQFATWPDSAFSTPDAPLRVCILGHDPFGSALDSLRGKQIGLRKLAIAVLTDVEYATACHVLFVSASEEPRLAEILDAVSSQPVLTVADFEHFATAGGIVGLTEVDDRSRLEVNVGAAGQAGLKLSSKLLRLAETVDSQTAQFGTASEK